jgi:uncharacterized protein YkwD
MQRSLFALLIFGFLFPVSAAAQSVSPTSIEQAVLNEMNAARRNPQKYIGYLEEYRKLFKGNTIHYPNRVTMDTIEGAAAVDDAIAYMKTLSRLDSYGFSAGLAKPAGHQLKDLMENNKLGHFGKDGSRLPQRISAFGIATMGYAENITYFVDLPREIVLTMIIDDGVASRGHRKNLFSSNFRVVGIAFGRGRENEGLCVTIFAGAFREMRLPKGVRRL